MQTNFIKCKRKNGLAHDTTGQIRYGAVDRAPTIHDRQDRTCFEPPDITPHYKRNRRINSKDLLREQIWPSTVSTRIAEFVPVLFGRTLCIGSRFLHSTVWIFLAPCTCGQCFNVPTVWTTFSRIDRIRYRRTMCILLHYYVTTNWLLARALRPSSPFSLRMHCHKLPRTHQCSSETTLTSHLRPTAPITFRIRIVWDGTDHCSREQVLVTRSGLAFIWDDIENYIPKQGQPSVRRHDLLESTWNFQQQWQHSCRITRPGSSETTLNIPTRCLQNCCIMGPNWSRKRLNTPPSDQDNCTSWVRICQTQSQTLHICTNAKATLCVKVCRKQHRTLHLGVNSAAALNLNSHQRRQKTSRSLPEGPITLHALFIINIVKHPNFALRQASRYASCSSKTMQKITSMCAHTCCVLHHVCWRQH